MGVLKMLRNRNNAEGTRESIRMSYRKHVNMARSGRLPAVDAPHVIGLFGALASRYRVMGKESSEPSIYSELAPFLGMEESEGVEALAEYVVYQERPGEARLAWLREVINRSLYVPGPHTRFAIFGLMNHVTWSDWLGEKARTVIDAAGTEVGRKPAKESRSLEEWQDAVNIVKALLTLDAARTAGSVSSKGPIIDTTSCTDTLRRGKRMGIAPQPEKVERVLQQFIERFQRES